MTYEELKSICRMNHLAILQVATEAGLTLDGLKKGLNSESLSLRYVLPLCEALFITPNKFFGVNDLPVASVQTQNGGIGNTQVAETGTTILQEQLKEKDAQISRLLNIIEKLNK